MVPYTSLTYRTRFSLMHLACRRWTFRQQKSENILYLKFMHQVSAIVMTVYHVSKQMSIEGLWGATNFVWIFLVDKNFVIDQWNARVEICLKKPLYKKWRHSVYEKKDVKQQTNTTVLKQ